MTMLEQQDDFLTVDELCELLKIGHNTAYRLPNSGEVKAFWARKSVADSQGGGH